MSLSPENRAIYERVWRESAQARPRISFLGALDAAMDAARREGSNAAHQAHARALAEFERAEPSTPATCDTCHSWILTDRMTGSFCGCGRRP